MEYCLAWLTDSQSAPLSCSSLLPFFQLLSGNVTMVLLGRFASGPLCSHSGPSFFSPASPICFSDSSVCGKLVLGLVAPIQIALLL